MPKFSSVALPVPLRSTFTYSLEGLKLQPKIGSRVTVQFGPRVITGIIVDLLDTTDLPPARIKPLKQVLDADPVIPEELMALCHWASNYYLHPLGEVFAAALPQRLRDGYALPQDKVFQHTKEGLGLPMSALKRSPKQQEIHRHLLEKLAIHEDERKTRGFSDAALKAMVKKGLVHKVDLEICSDSSKLATDSLLNERAKSLNAQQEAVFRELRYHQYRCYLLNGITGSGKTEIYLQAAARVLQSGKQVLVLIPEIGLSPQTVERFKKRFNVYIAELHSNVAEVARVRAWQAAKTGSARIVIGTRLASLTPFKELGAIIVDEEHDRSYKQQDGFKYSARDLSIYRAHMLGIPVILGSATPSLESMANVARKKYIGLTLSKRAGNAEPPDYVTVDLRNAECVSGLSHQAIEHIRQTISRDEQVIVFINKRGFARALICHSCGWSSDCSHCDTRMTVHTSPQLLRCHHCDRQRPIPLQCPTCGARDLNTFGFGTEQLEQSLQTLFPSVPLVRIDRDSTTRKGSFQNMLLNAKDRGACIFVGTQMLAKGHHLPKLTLVIIADADQGLLGPDFRSLEQMGQLILQIAGRAGREKIKGTVLVQTHRPDHPALAQLLTQGYTTFAQKQLAQRYDARLPPYASLYEFRAEDRKLTNSISLLSEVKQILSALGDKTIRLVGPFPDSIERVNGRYRYCLNVLGNNRRNLHSTIKQTLPTIEQLPIAKKVRWSLHLD